jgi:nucleoside-diphosphate-sugar epimerase
VSPEEFHRVNVLGTATLLEAAGRAGIRRFFFMSSVAIYGDSSVPTTEETPPVPTGPYGATKLEAERLVAAWASQRPDRVVRMVRPTVVYGPGNRGNVFRLMRQIRSGFFVPVGRGGNVKSVAYVENLIDACLFALDRGDAGLAVYNYSDEPHLPFAEIVATICRLLGKPEPRFSIPLGPALAILGPVERLTRAVGWQLPVHAAALKMNKATCHESGKIRAEGFRQRVPTEEGLARMAAWFLHRGADDPAASGGEGGE